MDNTNNTNNTNNTTTPIIYVHSGAAHLDEIFAIGLLFLFRPLLARIARIERVEKIPDVLQDEDWVLDVGLEFDSSRNRYDHHQHLSPAGLCAAGLICRELDRGFFEFLMRDPLPGTPSWFRVLNYVDTRGPFAFKKEFGALTPDPFGPFLTEWFEKGDFHSRKGAASAARDIVEFWHKKYQEQQGIDELARHLQLEEAVVNGVRIVLIPTADTRLSSAVARLQGWGEQDPAIQVGFDDRGDGMYILRRGDHPAVDLSILAGQPGVAFAHKGGFICKTLERMTLPQVCELIATCVKKQ